MLTPEGSQTLAGGRAPARPPVALVPNPSTPEGSQNLALTTTSIVPGPAFFDPFGVGDQ